MSDIEWRSKAACRVPEQHGLDREDWFPLPSQQAREAKAVCLDCPVRKACGREAERFGQHGIWAGFSMPKQRGSLRRYLKLVDPPAEQDELAVGTCADCGAGAVGIAQHREQAARCHRQSAGAHAGHVPRVRQGEADHVGLTEGRPSRLLLEEVPGCLVGERMSKNRRGYFVLAKLNDVPAHEWEASWTGVFPLKRDAVRALRESQKRSPQIEFALGVVTWEAL